MEITLTTVVAYGSYLAAESVHVSGVIAVVAASLVVGNYGLPRGMTPASRMAVLSFWEYAAFAVNSMVFLLVGLEITVMPVADSLLPVLVAAAVVLAARALSVYSLSALLSAVGQVIPSRWRHVLVWSGLRGALSMAMVLGISPVVPERDILIPVIFGVVLLSLVGQGLTIEPLVARLGLSRKQSDLEAYQLLLGENMSLRVAVEELDRNVRQGAISQSVRDEMAEQIVVKQQAIEQRIARLHMSDENIAADEQKKAERIVLLAQKTAFHNAARSGIMEWSAAAKLISQLETEQEMRAEQIHDAEGGSRSS
ncbi:Na(+)/H(+) antiporter NhaG [Sporomusa ovata DSM 2662]|uniref:Na+/H+ antiporter n=1 Tax=Sporomusa ovata TaxID=2378 RepID=A0A0U1L1G9_9FIRM|nr:NhaP-type Na+/H+ and K+/H+ antiporter [Sporomusa ovata DSM 2662]CQR73528.1 Na+/H+ antiporter [Sporomusa ovata]